MESTFNMVDLSSCDEPNNINNNAEFIDQWPIDIGSCEGDDIIKEYLNNMETSSSVEPNRVCRDDDCMILTGNPDKPIVVAVDEKIESDDILFVKEKGQVACRDFPHARHSCANFPFSTTSHEQYCKMCYCFVCDSPAPCKFWSDNPGSHCHASDKFKSWIFLREKHKDAIANTNKAIAPTRRQAPNVPNSSNPDFSHFRHSCANFPFNTTSHDQHCKMCHCFVCDSPAPCRFWTHTLSDGGHCHASDKFESWTYLRNMLKEAVARQVPNAFSRPADACQQQVLNTQHMINTNGISHIQTQAHPKSKRQPYSNAPSNVKRCLGLPSAHRTQFKKHGNVPSDEDVKTFWLTLAAIADELEVSECSKKRGSEP